ncbi:MAG: SLC13 family permease [Parvularculaceae bacterium]|nr:SLC13 family permease [Parvularculaceae bacterium]
MSDLAVADERRTPIRLAGLCLGVAFAATMLWAGPPEGLSPSAWAAACLAVLMLTWWVTEAIPIAATALLPMVVLPLAGVSPLKEAAASYMDPTVVLLMAGFIIAKGIERWNLHARIALHVVSIVGARPAAMILGFMIATTLISMWISNTATALMMTPIALSVAKATQGATGENKRFVVALLLGVCWAASIGGLATPVGSPTNLIVIGYLNAQGADISFLDWVKLGLPVVLIMTPLAWGVLALYGGRGVAGADPAAAKAVVRDALAALGRTTTPEARVLVLFLAIAGAWMTQPFLIQLPGLKHLNDQVIAVAGALLFFLAPSGSRTEPRTQLLDWRTAEQIPWGVVLLFGGGLSLAAAVSKTGVADWLAGGFTGLFALPDIVIVLALTAFVILLTEVTSNVATAAAMMPMVGALASAGGVDPFLLAAPVGLAASCGFMLPIATGPNAVIYATGAVTTRQMIGLGVWADLLALAAITFAAGVLVPLLF